MNKKSCLILVILCFLTGLSGCRLAHPDAAGKTADRLIGAYISYDRISQGEEVRIGASGEIRIETDDEKGKVYAFKTEEIKETETGEKYTDVDYDFPDVPGIKMMIPELEDPLNKGIRQMFALRGPGVAHISVESKKGLGEKDFNRLSGTVYQDADQAGSLVYINPVFQTADGRVYLRAGQGFSVVGDNLSGSFRQTRTMRAVTVINNGSEKKQEETVVEVTVALESPLKEVAIIQMDEQNEIVARQSFAIGQIPEKLLPKQETEYFIVAISKDAGGKREQKIYGKDQNSFSYLRPGENGCLIEEMVEIGWKE